jgi:hypothetical protein
MSATNGCEYESRLELWVRAGSGVFICLFEGGCRAGFDLAEGADERERKRPSAPRRAEKLGKRIPLVGDPGKAEKGF